MIKEENVAKANELAACDDTNPYLPPHLLFTR